jgi:hypothetical protein
MEPGSGLGIGEALLFVHQSTDTVPREEYFPATAELWSPCFGVFLSSFI